MRLQIAIGIISGMLLLILFSPVYADDEAERYWQAGHPSTTADVFTKLAADSNAAIRKRVASNRKTPANVLMKLAHDTDITVKIALATNLSAPENIYLVLAKDREQVVRSVVARFEYVPVSALLLLARDIDTDVRMEVARNLNSNEIILNQLMKDPNDNVSAVAEQALIRLHNE